MIDYESLINFVINYLHFLISKLLVLSVINLFSKVENISGIWAKFLVWN